MTRYLLMELGYRHPDGGIKKSCAVAAVDMGGAGDEKKLKPDDRSTRRIKTSFQSINVRVLIRGGHFGPVFFNSGYQCIRRSRYTSYQSVR